jgi:Diguanylate cyclase, GGDEF domain
MQPGDTAVEAGTKPSTSSSVTADHCVVLSWKWFAFLVRAALSHACRHADYVTLVTIRASREYVGATIDVGAQALTEIADVIDPTIRAADIVGQLEHGELGILLSDADEEAAAGIIRRFAERLGHVRFSAPMTFAIGTASCPTDGVRGDDLVAHAMMHPVVDVCSGSAPLDDSYLPC